MTFVKLLCWLGIHSWDRYGRVSFNSKSSEPATQTLECVRCGHEKTVRW